ncbi:exonuclease domain-containing protein [Flagellimonas halotolerans]|uniref:Excinuclease cho n=1 Tax=Flagellimonas halotolerans TaxID=3112164 RepID=A0ABU6IQ92_9FLAO|nr:MULTISPECIES: exonuclease domain-containing protein [unclassified Allomuricauda]MEC3965328.1 exonuclease domain-containing protein [Muricauda sp. SYSU M86414]MEC4265194.1 exonuclease domain-containing protein [Muricauda sp. SYSU M84420]
MYTIIDIETTGNGIKGNKITEISIFKYDGNQVVDEFTSLVNPQCPIPYFITGLTGIDDQMVQNAPTFPEIADTVKFITEGCIFVAHSVNFDYGVIKEEFRQIGIDFTRKKLCTVRLSRKLIPGLRSYSLGKLCSAVQIPLMDRHRARGDAHATVLLFEKLLRKPESEVVFKKFLNARSQEATLPPHLPKSVFDKIPQKPGIYYFMDQKGEIIYVGKAINLKKRVLGHFYDKSRKEIQMCSETANIDFKLAGSELVALLMESAEIKRLFPPYNRAQKRTGRQYAIFAYEDRNGIMHLAYNTIKGVPNPLKVIHNQTECRAYLEEVCKSFSLCPRYCHLQQTNAACSHHEINSCGGICTGDENPEEYNQKVEEAIANMKLLTSEVRIIKEKGRDENESAVVLIADGIYKGFGFIDTDLEISTLEDVEAFITPQKHTVETESILTQYFLKHDKSQILVH